MDQPQLGSGETDERRPRARSPPRQRAGEQRPPLDPDGLAQPDFERDASAEAVADHVNAVELEGIEQIDAGGSEESRVVGCADRLVGVAEAWQVERDNSEPV